MKKLLTLIGLLGIFVGCEQPVAEKDKVRYENGQEYIYESHVLIIDGCQYVRLGHGLAHKGNYTNSIHIYNVEKH